MADRGWFGDPSVIESMSAEHLLLWRSLFRACRAHLTPGVRVLDFGCGNGGMLAYLLNGDGREWLGCDPGLAVGIDRFSSAPASAFPGQFDLVLSHEVIYLLADLVSTFREIHASLRPGGVAALATGCHEENGLYPKWREAFEKVVVLAYQYRVEDYVRALENAGFGRVVTTRLLLTRSDYEEWVCLRGDAKPNADWFPDAAAECRYYTETGKPLIFATRTS